MRRKLFLLLMLCVVKIGAFAVAPACTNCGKSSTAPSAGNNGTITVHYNNCAVSLTLHTGNPNGPIVEGPLAVNGPGSYTFSGLGYGHYFYVAEDAVGQNAGGECIGNVLFHNPACTTGPVITASGPLEFCDGGSVTLTSTAADYYYWSTGDTTSSIVVTTSGSY